MHHNWGEALRQKIREAEEGMCPEASGSKNTRGNSCGGIRLKEALDQAIEELKKLSPKKIHTR